MSVLCFNSLRYPFPCLILSDLASPGERKTTTPPTYLCEVTGINREPWDGHTLAGLCMLFNSYCNKPLAHPKTSSWCGTAFFWAMSRLWNVPSVSASERQRVDIMFMCVCESKCDCDDPSKVHNISPHRNLPCHDEISYPQGTRVSEWPRTAVGDRKCLSSLLQ